MNHGLLASVFGSGLLTNILAAAIWLVAGFLVSRGYEIYRRRRADALLTFTGWRSSLKHLHVIYGLVERPGVSPAFSVEEGDVSALCAALALAQKRFGVKRVQAVNSYAALPTFGGYENLFVVSGPVWNGIAKFYLDSSQAPTGFVEQQIDGKMVDVLTTNPSGRNTQYFTEVIEGQPRECYALILSESVPCVHGGSTQHVTIAAGISPLGTFGAVHWLRGLDGQKWQDAFPGRDKGQPTWRYAVIKVEDKSPKGFRSYASELNTPAFLKLELVEVEEG